MRVHETGNYLDRVFNLIEMMGMDTWGQQDGAVGETTYHKAFDLSSIPGTYIKMAGNSVKLSSDLHMHAMRLVLPTSTQNKNSGVCAKG